MSVYVAGKWGDSEKISKKIRELEKLGISITLNWTKCKEENCNKEQQLIADDTLYNEPFDNKELNPVKHRKELQRDAEEEINAVRDANYIIAIMDDPEYTYRGTFTEVGASLGLNKTVFIYNPNEQSRCMTNCFYWHKNCRHYKDWEELKTYIYNVINHRL